MFGAQSPQPGSRPCQHRFRLRVGQAAVPADKSKLLKELVYRTDPGVRAAVVALLAEDLAVSRTGQRDKVRLGGNKITDPGNKGDALGRGRQGAVENASDQSLKGGFGKGFNWHGDIH